MPAAPSADTRTALQRLSERIAPSGTYLATQPLDDDARCLVARGPDGDRWQPVPCGADGPALDGLAAALGERLHPDFLAWYGSFWSGHLEARLSPRRAWPDAPGLEAGAAVTLLQICSPADCRRLIDNQIGHVFQTRQRRRRWWRRQAPGTDSLFVGLLESPAAGTDLLISLDNTAGFVLLEDPAKGVLARVANSARDFLDALDPPPGTTAP